jgi:undecaprenyl-diphosphatase
MPITLTAGSSTALPGTPVLPPKGLNTSLYLDLNHTARSTAWAHGFMHAYALWLGPTLLVAVFLIAYAIAWWRRAGRACALLILAGIGTLAALGLNQLVGHAARELRPYRTHPHVLVLVGRSNDYSFPSDHAVLAGSLIAAMLVALGPSVWRSSRAVRATGRPRVVVWLSVVNVLFGLFLCFGRVYVGVHYPGDVVAGLLLGMVVVAVVSLLRPIAYRLAGLVRHRAFGSLLARQGAAF